MPSLTLAFLLISAVATAAQAQPADPPDAAKIRAKQLKRSLDTFRLELPYHYDITKRLLWAGLTFSVPPPPANDRTNRAKLIEEAKRNRGVAARLVQISEKEAGKIVDYLAAEGFLAKAADLRNTGSARPPTTPGFTLKVGPYYEDLGWRLPMLKRLDGLRTVLEGKAAKEMDELLGKMSALRKLWEKDATEPKGREWRYVFAEEHEYQANKSPEEIFRGTLQLFKGPQSPKFMQSHRYDLGDRSVAPGCVHPELEKLVGQEVEIRGKRYDIDNLEGEAVREILPGAIRPVAPSPGQKPAVKP